MLILAAVTTACARESSGPPAVAMPSLTLSDVAAVGSPLEMTYRFVVADDAPAFTEDYLVFVHFLDSDDELMWTDDHAPPMSTRDWKQGATIAYSRTMFVPRFPYAGETGIEVGLYSPTTGDRLPMTGETSGQRSYRVGSFDMRLQSDNLFVVFRDGWHDAEISGEFAGPQWQWSQKEATLSFSNPERDVRVYVQLDQPVAVFSEPQRVEVRVGSTVIDSFFLPASQIELRRIQIPTGQLGTAEIIDLTVSVDKTFVPASIPALESGDTRELGVRVFRAIVQPS